MPLEEAELVAFLTQANGALIAIQGAYGRDNAPEARIRFPRGWIRTAETLRRTLPNIGTPLERRNASYAMMGVEPLRWLVVRTDLSGAALSMIVKQMLSVTGSLAEWMTRAPLIGHGAGQSFNRRSEILVEREIISEQQKAESDWLWERRSGIHLFLTTRLEHDDYDRRDWNRGVKAYRDLRDALIQEFGQAT